MDGPRYTIIEAHAKLKNKELSAVDLAKEYLDHIEKVDPDVHAYLEVFGDVEKQARAADERIARGEADMLTGIPIAIKDVILMDGRSASAGSKMLGGYKATYDATAIRRLKEKGAVFLGRTNLDEFAMGSSTENSAFTPTKNPHDLSRVPGGSSGGSAAAVAMHGALAALGSDTGGSIRQPAGFCGVVGLKPTYGAVSRSGLFAMTSSFDQIAPLAHTVGDTEHVFNAIRGHDAKDSTTIPEDVYARYRGKKKDGAKTIGVPRAFTDREGIDPDVLAVFNHSLEKMKEKGYVIRDIELPHINHSLATYYIILFAEASTNLARFDGVRYGLSLEGDTMRDGYFKTRGTGFGKEVRRRIMLGTYVLSSGYYDAYYRKANDVRALIRSDLERAFEDVDIIATPVSPTPAFKIGERMSDPLQMYLADIFTVPANLAGVPALSIPAGDVKRDGKKLPVGVQFIAPHCAEHLLFESGKKLRGEEEI